MMRVPQLFLLVLGASVSIFIVLSHFSTGGPSLNRMRIQSRYQGPHFVKDRLFDVSEENSSAQEKWEDSQADRVNSLQKQCQLLENLEYKFHDVKKSQLDHIIVNDKYKVMYCYVPKIACTNLKRIFLLLTGNMNTTDPLKLVSYDVHSHLGPYLNYLSSYSSSDILYRIQNYRKIVFVREPLERLLSAFRNKFVQRGNAYFKNRFGRIIIKRFRPNATSEALAKGDDVKFPEFVSYLLDPRTKKHGFNEHWAPISDLCLPCHLKYDIIGKYESIDEDVNKLLKLLSVDDIIQFPKRGDSYKTLKTEDLLGKFYKNISANQFMEVQKVYAEDSQLFSYDTPYSLKNLFNLRD